MKFYYEFYQILSSLAKLALKWVIFLILLSFVYQLIMKNDENFSKISL